MCLTLFDTCEIADCDFDVLCSWLYDCHVYVVCVVKKSVGNAVLLELQSEVVT